MTPEEKVEQLNGLVTVEGAKKILSFIEQNKLKYGEDIYDEYYYAYDNKLKELLVLGEVYHNPNGCLKCKKLEE